jgi:hypothetical protein
MLRGCFASLSGSDCIDPWRTSNIWLVFRFFHNPDSVAAHPTVADSGFVTAACSGSVRAELVLWRVTRYIDNSQASHVLGPGLLMLLKEPLCAKQARCIFLLKIPPAKILDKKAQARGASDNGAPSPFSIVFVEVLGHHRRPLDYRTDTKNPNNADQIGRNVQAR